MKKFSFIIRLSLFLVCMSRVQAFNPSNPGIFELERDARAETRSILSRFVGFFKSDVSANAATRAQAVNPYNACIWKICSRPLKNRKPVGKIEVTSMPVAKQRTIDLLSELLKNYDLNRLHTSSEKWNKIQ